MEPHDLVIKLDARYEEIIRRLDVINGSVGSVTQRVTDAEFTLVRHQLECPTIEQFKCLEEKLDSLRTEVLTGKRPLSEEGQRRMYESERRLTILEERDRIQKGTANWIFQNAIKPLLANWPIWLALGAMFKFGLKVG